MASKRAPVVLNESHFDTLMDARRQLEEVNSILPHAKACGIDCAEYESMSRMADEQIQLWLKTWFPKGRPR